MPLWRCDSLTVSHWTTETLLDLHIFFLLSKPISCHLSSCWAAFCLRCSCHSCHIMYVCPVRLKVISSLCTLCALSSLLHSAFSISNIYDILPSFGKFHRRLWFCHAYKYDQSAWAYSTDTTNHTDFHVYSKIHKLLINHIVAVQWTPKCQLLWNRKNSCVLKECFGKYTL